MKILKRKISDHFCTKVSHRPCNPTASSYLLREFGDNWFRHMLSQFAGIVWMK